MRANLRRRLNEEPSACDASSVKRTRVHVHAMMEMKSASRRFGAVIDITTSRWFCSKARTA
eukprot:6214633-Pleurochrysis_carterae.AAC.2